MHSALACLGKVHAECLRTDALAAPRELRIDVAKEDEGPDFRWGYSDDIVRPKNKKAPEPMRLTFSRDVFLKCDSSIYHDYNLGFEDEFETGSSRVFLAYRLEYTHDFKIDGDGHKHHFPVTIFWEPARNVWRATAQIRHGEKKNTPFTRPPSWTAILAAHGLDSFGELAESVGRDRVMGLIDGMFDIAAKHVPSARQYRDHFGTVLYA